MLLLSSWRSRCTWRHALGLALALTVSGLAALQTLVAGWPKEQAPVETVEIKSAEDLAKVANEKIERAKLDPQWKRHLIHPSVKLRGHAQGSHKSPVLATDFASFKLDSMWPSVIVTELPRTKSIVEVRAKLWWYPATTVDEGMRMRQGAWPRDGQMPACYQLSDVEILDASEAGPVPIRAFDVCRNVEINGELNVPLGTLVELKGKWYEQVEKGEEKFHLVVEPIIDDETHWTWTATFPVSKVRAARQGVELTPRDGVQLRLRAFELGRVVGVSDEVRKALGPEADHMPDLDFVTTLYVISSEPINKKADRSP